MAGAASKARRDDQPGVARARQTRAQTRAFYDRISRIYDLLSENSEAPVRGASLTRLAPRAGERVLEVGCGTGPSLPALARAVGPRGRVDAIDLSPGMLHQARRRLVREGLDAGVVLTCADAARLPYPDGVFDAVLMTFTLELFDTPEIPHVLAECRRVLRDGGRIVVAGVSKAGSRDPLRWLFEWTHEHFPSLMDCRPIYVRRALEAAGFDAIVGSNLHCWVPVEIVSGRN